VPFDPTNSPEPKTPIIPHSVQDQALKTFGADSITQKVRRLNAGQRAVFENLCAGMDPSEACREAGYLSTGPMQALINKIPDLMDRLGLTDEYLINEKLKPLLVAEETKFFHCKVEGQTIYIHPDGTKELKDTTEIMVEERTVHANDIRLRALELAFKLRGSIVKPREDMEDPHSRDINVQVIHIGAEGVARREQR
jgi:hypothetical protein